MIDTTRELRIDQLNGERNERDNLEVLLASESFGGFLFFALGERAAQ